MHLVQNLTLPRNINRLEPKPPHNFTYLSTNRVLLTTVQVTILIIAMCARLHGSIIVVTVPKVLL